MPQKIVYLLGSGATHAVVKNFDITKSLLTSDIQTFIGRNFTSRGIGGAAWNELLKTKDVEHLISVLEFQHRRAASERVRSYYRRAIISLSAGILKSLPANLYTVLCDLHQNIDSDVTGETLSCFLTLNYEDILEQSIEKHLGLSIDYGIDRQPPMGTKTLKVYKLHGSFNWTTTCPVEIHKMTAIDTGAALWIPPGVDKRRENYPFNLLWGKATEQLMDCDVLRIVGCSLSRNDWGLIPIIYTVQKFHSVGHLRIEVIDYPSIGDSISSNYSYLRATKFSRLPEILDQYRKQIRTFSDDELSDEIESAFQDRDKTNPFKSWLEAKIESIVTGSASSATMLSGAKYVDDFYNKLS